MAGQAWIDGGAAAEDGRLLPRFIQRRVLGERDRLCATAAEFNERTQHAGVGALAFHQCAEDRLQEMREFTEESARLLRRAGGSKLEDDRQIVGQFVRRQDEPVLLVGLHEIDHGGSTVARIAMDMLEQMQRSGAPAIKELHIVGFGGQFIHGRQSAQERLEFLAARKRYCSLRIENGGEFGQPLAVRGVGIGQQGGQHPQSVGQRLGAVAIQMTSDGSHVTPPLSGEWCASSRCRTGWSRWSLRSSRYRRRSRSHHAR